MLMLTPIKIIFTIHLGMLQTCIFLKQRKPSKFQKEAKNGLNMEIRLKIRDRNQLWIELFGILEVFWLEEILEFVEKNYFHK